MRLRYKKNKGKQRRGGGVRVEDAKEMVTSQNLNRYTSIYQMSHEVSKGCYTTACNNMGSVYVRYSFYHSVWNLLSSRFLSKNVKD
jgi:hypothetical protein